jgi:hypothetical protein
MRFRAIFLAAAAAILAVSAPVPRALAQSQDPCATALGAATTAAQRRTPGFASKYGPLGADRRDVREVLQRSSLSAARRARAGASTAARPAADRDENHVAILEDTNGDLIIRANPFDLVNTGLRFEPANGGYAVSSAGAGFRGALGRPVPLGDDDSAAQALAFPFAFYGRSFTSLFINSDGNLTFEEADNASTERGIHRLASGPPRVAPFFADLDPSAGGRVFVDAAPDAFTITWCAVPGFGVAQTATVQATLFPAGAIEFRYGFSDLDNAIVALSPGGVEGLNAIDLSRPGALAQTGAIGELFRASAELDLAAAARRFYATHPDEFDQVVFWTDTPVMTDAFAFEVSVKNAITGTGLEVFDFAAELGSGGTLQSVINMDRISKYPESLTLRIFGENSALGILAHETGHRWLARLQFVDVNRRASDALLGRQRAHWSFFVDSDGSVMEGNEIEDLGGGVFRTQSTTEKYSRLDLYAMGLATAAEVPGWFYVDAPIAAHEREDAAVAGITFNGTRRTVLIQDVIDALGPRVPAAGDSPREFRQAYVFVRQSSAVLVASDLARLVRIREQFGPFFSRATEGRMTLRTTLTP